MTKVSIGIQARSSSHRFPNKISELIGNRTMLQHVMEACLKASQYLNNSNTKKILTNVTVLVPYDDQITARIASEIPVIEGPEDDVLSRYFMLMEKTKADYICRITADCPLLPQFVISKLITIATMNEYDYVSNVEERCRTAPDGFDCEVISRRALEFADTYAAGPDREHVTTLLRSHPPTWFKEGCVINFLDLSSHKLSVDTEEDLERVRQEYVKVQHAYDKAVAIFGKQAVHKF